jgi:UDP-N-acetylmuramoylalanine--D-glutamate ligase
VSEGKVKMAILLGEAKDIIAESFKGVIPYSFADSMDDAVSQAFSASETGDAVLLAPACSSFDMFKDYIQRGRVFQEAVKRLNDDRG